MEKLNKVYIVGTLNEVSPRFGTSSNGSEYIAGDFVVQVGEEGDNLIKLSFYSNKLKKDGNPNKKYDNYAKLEGMKGQRIEVRGELRGREFFKPSDGQVIFFNEISAGFVNDAKADAADTATFEFVGYVRKPVYERLNKEEKIVGYKIEIGQANYSENGLNTITFDISPKLPKVLEGVRSYYGKGTTVYISGQINHQVEQVTVTEEAAFGEPLVKEFTNTYKYLIITSGKEPILNEKAYSKDNIATLEAFYAENLAKIEKEAKDKNEEGKAVTESAPAKSTNNRLLF